MSLKFPDPRRAWRKKRFLLTEHCLSVISNQGLLVLCRRVNPSCPHWKLSSRLSSIRKSCIKEAKRTRSAQHCQHSSTSISQRNSPSVKHVKHLPSLVQDLSRTERQALSVRGLVCKSI